MGVDGTAENVSGKNHQVYTPLSAVSSISFPPPPLDKSVRNFCIKNKSETSAKHIFRSNKENYTWSASRDSHIRRIQISIEGNSFSFSLLSSQSLFFAFPWIHVGLWLKWKARCFFLLPLQYASLSLCQHFADMWKDLRMYILGIKQSAIGFCYHHLGMLNNQFQNFFPECTSCFFSVNPPTHVTFFLSCWCEKDPILSQQVPSHNRN